MAFFGLTALGPQDNFAATSRGFCNIYVFEDADFENAWKRAVGDVKNTKMGSLPAIFKILFHGPPPANDQEQLDIAFNWEVQDENNPLSFAEFMNTMMQLRADVVREEQDNKNKSKKHVEFNSSVEFKDSLKRHHRMERRLQDKQNNPLTCSQEYGWERQDLQKPKAGRETSAVAKFAEELIRNGIYY
jgi:hypothetical protein